MESTIPHPNESLKASERLEICKKCENLKPVLSVSRCALCNCVMFFKTKLESAKCPIGKW